MSVQEVFPRNLRHGRRIPRPHLKCAQNTKHAKLNGPQWPSARRPGSHVGLASMMAGFFGDSAVSRKTFSRAVPCGTKAACLHAIRGTASSASEASSINLSSHLGRLHCTTKSYETFVVDAAANSRIREKAQLSKQFQRNLVKMILHSFQLLLDIRQLRHMIP